jgi:hypothetical protein
MTIVPVGVSVMARSLVVIGSMAVMPTVADPDVQPDTAVTVMAIAVTVMPMAAVMTAMAIPGERLTAQAETK